MKPRIRISKFERNKAINAYFFISIPAIFLFVFWVYPVFVSISNSFFKWDLANPKVFIGFENYVKMFTDIKFWNSVKVTVIYSVSTIIPTILISLLLAVLLNRKLLIRSLLRSAFFLPWTVAFLAVAIIWKWLYNPSFGLINLILIKLHLPSFNWLNDPRTALLSLVVVGIWWGLGYNLIIYLAALQAIDQQLYEASAIDGANEWQKFWHITFPGISQANVFVVIISIINAFQLFDSPYAMTRGGPAGMTKTMVYYIYETAMRKFEFGYACTLSLVLFVIVLIFALVTIRIFNKGFES